MMSSGNTNSPGQAIFRVDASEKIGSGHLFRCLTLASCLRDRGFSISFACSALPDSMATIVLNEGFKLISLSVEFELSDQVNVERTLGHREQEADAIALLESGEVSGTSWIIVDHYGLDEHWERLVRPHCEHMLAIDDLANRHHVSDILLDQNLGSQKRFQYRTLTLSSTRLLLGPEFALLRPEFLSGRSRVTIRQGGVRRVLVSFGGVDPTNEASKTVQALKRTPGISNGIDVVAGAGNPNAENLRRLCMEDRRIRFYREVSNMAELMAQADLAIGGCGATSWERCAMYLPAVAVVVSENQREIAAGLLEANAAEIVGWHTNVSDKDIELVVVNLCESPSHLTDLSRAAGCLVDGKGVQRVMNEMEVMHGSARLLH